MRQRQSETKTSNDREIGKETEKDIHKVIGRHIDRDTEIQKYREREGETQTEK